MREPLLLHFAALATGIGACRVTRFEPPELLWALAAIFILTGVAVARKLNRAVTAGTFAGVAVAGALLATLDRPAPPPVIDVSPHEFAVISGCVVEPPVFRDGRQRFLAEFAPGARAQVNVYYEDGEQPLKLVYGQRVDVAGRIRRPHSYQNAGSFDYAKYLADQNIYWTVSVSSPANVTRLDGECGPGFWSAIHGLRGAALKRLEVLFPGDPQRLALLRAILLGESSQLEEDWKESFRETGTYHTLVISGLHLTILAGFLHLLLRWLPLPAGPRIVVIIGAAWLYAFVTGCNTPVLRAAAGLSLFLMAAWFFRRRRLLNILAAIAILFLVIDPDQLFDASFHLSFLAVAMIGAFAAPLIERHLEPFRRGLKSLHDADRDLHLEPRVAQFRVELRLLGQTVSLWTGLPERAPFQVMGLVLRGFFYLAELAVVSAVIQIGLVLPMAVYFHRLSITGLFANPVVVPLMSLALPAGFLAIFTGWAWLASVAGTLVDLALRIVTWAASFESHLRVPPPPLWLGAAFLLSLLLAAAAIRSGRRWVWLTAAPTLVLVLVIALHPFAPVLAPGQLELTMIDVGQAESLFLVLPDGKTMVVDGGGIPSRGKYKPRMDPGEDVVAPYLWSRSIQRLDVLVSSHGHEDHIGGLHAILRDFRPRELWLSNVARDPATLALAAEATALGTRVVSLSAGQGFSAAGVDFQVLAPAADRPPATVAANEDSLVLRLSYGRNSFLLTGDVESATEAWLTATVPRTDVLKVAHHGSRTSSGPAFLDAARPAVALISAGFENPYRFPHAQVLEEFSRRRSAVFRTDHDGCITLRSDGRRISVETYRWAVAAGT